MHAGMRERDLSGVALAAPESALGGWKGVIISLSLSWTWGHKSEDRKACSCMRMVYLYFARMNASDTQGNVGSIYLALDGWIHNLLQC